MFTIQWRYWVLVWFTGLHGWAWAAEPGLEKGVVFDRVTGALQVDVQSQPPQVRVNEPVRFKVKASRKAYVYLFTIDQPSGEVVQLFPNAYQRNNVIPGQQTLVLPDDRQGATPVQFSADQPGEEKFIVLVSEQPIATGATLSQSKGPYAHGQLETFSKGVLRPSGMGEASSGTSRVVKDLSVTVLPAITKTYPLSITTVPEAKRIRILNIAPVYQAGMTLPAGRYQIEATYDHTGPLTRWITLDDTAESQRVTLRFPEAMPAVAVGATAAPNSSKSGIFLMLDNTELLPGEQVQITFGAEQPGYVHLLLALPDHSLQMLKSQAITANQFVKLTANATPPLGEQKVVALYSRNVTMSENEQKRLLQWLEGTDEKALTLQKRPPLDFVFKSMLIQAKQQ